MPASGQTPNYKIPIYKTGDTANYLNSYNTAMSLIDTAIQQAKESGDTAQLSYQELNAIVTSLNQSFIQLNALVGKIEPVRIPIEPYSPNVTTLSGEIVEINGICDLLTILSTISNASGYTTFVHDTYSEIPLFSVPYNIYNIASGDYTDRVGFARYNFTTSTDLSSGRSGVGSIRATYTGVSTVFCLRFSTTILNGMESLTIGEVGLASGVTLYSFPRS